MPRKEAPPASPIAVPPVVTQAPDYPGQPLDRNTRRFMVIRFARDFDDVPSTRTKGAEDSASSRQGNLC
jgi:hypothetical protein